MASSARWRCGARGCSLLLVVIVAGLGVHADAGLKDPTRPPDFRYSAVRSASGPPPWNLTSTLISPTRRVAVINNRAVEIGDRVDSAQVVAIEAGSVQLRGGEGEFTVRMLAVNVKQPARQGRSPEGIKWVTHPARRSAEDGR
ncbi:MAG: hypothetical protein ACYC18_07870 [Gammaproteobacteria bacterium]